MDKQERLGGAVEGESLSNEQVMMNQQRFGLACALINDPLLLFLDKPSSALDPVGQSEVRQLLQKLKNQGITIFLNSHLLEDVELLCDRVALLNNGQIVPRDSSLKYCKSKPVGIFVSAGLLRYFSPDCEKQRVYPFAL